MTQSQPDGFLAVPPALRGPAIGVEAAPMQTLLAMCMRSQTLGWFGIII